MAAKEIIERIALAVKDQNEEAILVEALSLAELVFTALERIAVALENIAHNTAPKP